MTSEPTIIIVDDDEAIRDSLTRALKIRGYNAVNFASAEEFLATFDPLQAGCLVLDVSMPGMSGMELQQVLLDKKSVLPIIFITGHGDIEMSVQAVKEGAVDFIEKPFRQEKLLERIEEALEENKRLRQTKIDSDGVSARFNQLTPREQEVMKILVSDAGSLTNKYIANELDISHRTVDHHRARIMEKMNAKSLPDLIAMSSNVVE